MKKILFLMLLLFPWAMEGAPSRSPVQTVSYFGKCLSQYLDGEDDIRFRTELDQMTVGQMKCLVDDNISDLISSLRGLPDGAMHIDDYLTQLRQWSFDEDIQYTMDAPVEEKDFEVPSLNNEVRAVAPMRVISARVHLSGDRTYDMTEIFFVRGEMITKIHSMTMGENSIGYALWLYNQKRYDEAFRIFRSLAHKNSRNYEAIYYTTVMEIRRQGCSHLAASVRDSEAAAYLFKAILIDNSQKRGVESFEVTDESLYELIRLAKQVNFSSKKLPLYGTPFGALLYGRFQIASDNRVLMKKKDLVGFMDDKGKMVIPCKYDCSFGFNRSGYAPVSTPGSSLWGYISVDGKEIVPPKWVSVSYDVKDGKAFVSDESGNTYLIEVETGSIIRKMDGNYRVANAYSLGDYVALVSQNSDGRILREAKLDIVDFEGNIVFHKVAVQEIENLHMAIVSNGRRLWSTDRHFY